MQDWVKRKLDLLDELFPSGRLEHSKSRIRAVWDRTVPPDRYPFTYGYALFNMYNALHTPEERLRHSLDEFIIHGTLNDDFIPALFPGCRQSTIPNMFGATEIAVGEDVTCDRIVISVEDIERLPEPSIGPGTVARMWLEMQEYFLDETEGRLPVHVVDMQGPLDVCGQLMSYDALLLLALDDPEHFRMLLERATDAFILLWRVQKELLGDLFVGTHLFGHNWVPESFGASISIDSLVMYGPDFYREFVAPSIERIGEAFGPVAAHSCGDFSANVGALCETPYMSGINASQMSIQQMLDAGLDPEMVIIAFANPDAVADAFQALRSGRLHADMTIDGMPWPTVDDGIIHPSDWTQADWDHLLHIEQEIERHANIEIRDRRPGDK